MKGKIFNVIPLSGSAYNYWGFWDKGNGVKNARELASGVHCNYPDLAELIECLRDVPPEQLTILRSYINGTWRPIMDDYYFPKSPKELLEENHDFNLFISDLPDDGYDWLFDPTQEYTESFEEMTRSHIRDVTVPSIDEFQKMSFLEEVVYHEYFPYSELGFFDWFSMSDWIAATRFLDTDTQYEDGAFNGAKAYHEVGGKVYYFGMDGPYYYAYEDTTPDWLRFIHFDDIGNRI